MDTAWINDADIWNESYSLTTGGLAFKFADYKIGVVVVWEV